MTRKWILSIIIIIVLFVGGFVILKQANWPDEEQLASTDPGLNEHNIVSEEEIKEYVNNEIGFSMQIPREVYMKGEDSTQVFNIRVCEDNENGNIFLYYNSEQPIKKIKDETVQHFEYKYTQEEECEKIKKDGSFNLANLSLPSLHGLTFKVEKIEEQEDIISFVKDEYGGSCEVESTEEVEKDDGIYKKVKVGPFVLSTSDEDEDCIVNYIYQILYSPKFNKLVSVKLGQDVNFLDQEGDAFDYKIIDSIKLTQ
jgi:hypothetical protein